MAGLESGPDGWVAVGWVLDDIVKKTREKYEDVVGMVTGDSV